MVCAVKACGRPVHCRGLCNSHYRRHLRDAPIEAPMKRLAPKGALLEWLTALANEAEGVGCRDWPFGRTELGYPRRTRRGPPAHILLAMVGRPRPSPKLEVLHSCDRPPCLAPWHLRWGTSAENSADMAERGRSTKAERSGKAKLTWEAVDIIRSEHIPGRGRSQGNTAELAIRFGICDAMVRRVAKGQLWIR